MVQRTTLILGEDSRQQLAELSEVHGSQSAAIREAITVAHAALLRDQKRRAFIDELVAEGGQPTPEDRQWARRVAVKAAAAAVEARQL